MALDILRDPEGSGLPELISPDQSELTLAGLWWLAAECMAQRPAVCVGLGCIVALYCRSSTLYQVH